MVMNLKALREDFPALCLDDPIAYLDNACVTLRPQSVIDAISDYYINSPGCGGRSVHRFSTTVSKTIAQSRKTLAGFFNAPSVNELVFTRNATHSLNQVAKGLSWNEGDVILTTDREHNSNLVPWLQLEEEQGVDHRVVPSNSDNTFDLEAFEAMCSEAGEQLKMVSVSQVGNLDGVETPIREITKIAKDFGALVCVDGAQSAPHMPVDVQEMGIDFFAFSIHKMLGPSGMGGLWGREELLNSMRTIQSGGQTVKTSHYDAIEWAKAPSKFEGGLGHFAGMMATGAAIDYLSTLNMNDVHDHEVRLNTIMSNGVKDLEGVSIIGPEDPSQRGGICSLLLDENLPVHDIALLLDEVSGVMVRSGQHCVHSWFNSKGYSGSLRASAYFYNTEEDVRRFVDTFSEAVQAFQ